MLQWPFDGVLPGLVPGNALGGSEVGVAAYGAEEVEILAHVDFELEFVPQLNGSKRRASQETIGENGGAVAGQDCHALPEPSGLAPPTCLAVKSSELGVDSGEPTTRE